MVLKKIKSFLPETSTDSNLKSLTGYSQEEWERALGQPLNTKEMTLGQFYNLIIAELTRLHKLEEKGMPFPDQE